MKLRGCPNEAKLYKPQQRNIDMKIVSGYLQGIPNNQGDLDFISALIPLTLQKLIMLSSQRTLMLDISMYIMVPTYKNARGLVSHHIRSFSIETHADDIALPNASLMYNVALDMPLNKGM